MRSLSRGIGVGLLSGAWLAVLSLILAPIYVHLLGIESYGLIGLYTAALAMGGLLDVALSATVSREIAWIQARPFEHQRIATLLRSVEIVYWLAVFGLTLILLAAVAVFGSGWVRASALPDNQITGALALMSLSLAIQLPSGLYTASLIGLHRQARSAALLAGFGTVRGLGAALVAWGVSDDIRAFFSWHVVVGLVQIIWLRWQAWSHVRVMGGRSRFAIESLMSIRHVAGAMFLITAMGMMMSQMDKVVLASLVPLESLGYYTLAWSLASGLSIIATPVVQGFGARYSALASNDNDQELATNIVIASQLMFVLMIPPSVIASLFAEELVVLWTGSASVAAEVAMPLTYLLYGTAFVGCSYPFLYAIYAKKAFKKILHMQIVCLLAFFPLLIFSIYHSGITGAARCWSVYGAILLVAYPTLTLKIIRHRFDVSKQVRVFIFVVIISLIAGLVIKKFTRLAIDRFLLIPLIVTAILSVWFSALLVCNELRAKLATRS